VDENGAVWIVYEMLDHAAVYLDASIENALVRSYYTLAALINQTPSTFQKDSITATHLCVFRHIVHIAGRQADGIVTFV